VGGSLGGGVWFFWVGDDVGELADAGDGVELAEDFYCVDEAVDSAE